MFTQRRARWRSSRKPAAACPTIFAAGTRTLPWRSIRDAGNFYRHRYDDVIESYVSETVHVHLAPLLTVILAEIHELDGER